MDAKKEGIVYYTASIISGFGIGAVIGAAGKIVSTVVPPQMKIPYTIGTYVIAYYVGDKVSTYIAEQAVDMVNDLSDAFEMLKEKREALA